MREEKNICSQDCCDKACLIWRGDHRFFGSLTWRAHFQFNSTPAIPDDRNVRSCPSQASVMKGAPHLSPSFVSMSIWLAPSHSAGLYQLWRHNRAKRKRPDGPSIFHSPGKPTNLCAPSICKSRQLTNPKIPSSLDDTSTPATPATAAFP
jgi:hypothetical protein